MQIENLRREGISSERIHFVGNVMIDCLFAQLPKTEKCEVLNRLNLDGKNYAVLTLHRPSNVDEPEVFKRIIDTLTDLSEELQIVWPIHPRSRKRLESFGLLDQVAKSSRYKTHSAARLCGHACP